VKRGTARTTDQDVLPAWETQVAEAARNATLNHIIKAREAELLPLFAAHYERLTALPRCARRRLQRHGRRSLAALALWLALGATPALAAVINVGGGCSLPRAIAAANADARVGACARGSGADTIRLRPGSTHTLSAVNNGEPYGPTGLPVIRSTITIAGNGGAIRRAANAPNFRIFSVGGDGELTLQNTVVSGGASARGGGVYLVGSSLGNGTLTLANSIVTGNTGCGVDSRGDTYHYGYLTINNSTVSRNAKCGVNAGSSEVTVTNSTISGNTGAGVRLWYYSNARVIDSTIAGNQGKLGGGMFIQRSRVGMTSSTVSGNTAQSGGGMHVDYGIASLINSTVSGNSAARGGGLYAEQYADSGVILSLRDSTVTGNNAAEAGGGILMHDLGALTLERTIVSGNAAPAGREVLLENSATASAARFNLFGHGNDAGLVGFSAGATDIVPPGPVAAVLNTALAFNGGPTRTHVLVAGSPAIDAVTDGSCPPPAADQRDISRPQDGNQDGGVACDVGAVELTNAPPVTCAGRVATIVGTVNSESLAGTAGPDVIRGLAGDDRIAGFFGRDLICAGLGNDRVFGGPGSDQLFGERGNDRLVGLADNDQLNGGPGRDACDGGVPRRGDRAVSCERVRGVP
jgi:hypothetical protein